MKHKSDWLIDCVISSHVVSSLEYKRPGRAVEHRMRIDSTFKDMVESLKSSDLSDIRIDDVKAFIDSVR